MGQTELLFGDTDAETEILRMLARGMRNGEEIVMEGVVSAQEFNRAMTMLEIKGRVRSQIGRAHV